MSFIFVWILKFANEDMKTLSIAAQLRYILESEEIRHAMEPLELIKRVCECVIATWFFNCELFIRQTVIQYGSKLFVIN